MPIATGPMSNTAVVTPRATGVRRPSVKVSRPDTQSFNGIFGPDVYYEIIVVYFKKFKRFFLFRLVFREK